ncbi:hypothetical protein ABFS82_05G041200 [Erythranthe guttata]|uniref:uncharacterized protein LOC105966189 n=1 Tax=Erythranthe guttata TaxID=4155 RepID=UPI00064DF5A3|nr:PREDICTED: uncharacterized protein LOC105966189 [Erythranthe guttata]|eukprot:XP_012846209.1 PREDICTED: uncharacterized protein LOC105966189 [Erythranthe guttata]
MECRTPQQNPHSETLLSNPTNHVEQNSQRKAMEKFHRVIFKLAETHPNAPPLAPAFRTLLVDRLNQFGSQYKTPDHPPYYAMIEKALRELSEKQGSSEDSISQFLEKEYENLPWAHSMLLKHHLQKLCESGEIAVTRHSRYMLAGEKNHGLNSRAKVKKKRWRTKWRWDWERKKQRQRKKQLIKKRNQQKSAKVERTKTNQESDEKVQEMTENVVQHSEDKQVKEDETKKLLSSVDGEDGICGNPSFLPTEIPGVAASDEMKHSEEVSLQQQETGPIEIMKLVTQVEHQQETGPFEIMKPDTLAADEQEMGQFDIIKPDTLAALQQETGPIEIMKPDTRAAHQQETGPLEIMKPDTQIQQQQETGPSQIMKPDTQVAHQQETGPCQIMKPDTQAAQQQETGQSEIMEPAPHQEEIMKPDTRAAHQQETDPIENMKPEPQAVPTQLKQESEQSEHNKPNFSSPKKPPGFESIGVENLPHSGSRNMELASSAEEILSGSTRTRRQLRRWSMSSSEPKPVTMASLKPEKCCSLQTEPLIEPNAKIDSSKLNLTSNEPKLHLSNEDEPQRKKLRRSLRIRLVESEAVLLSSNSEEEEMEEQPKNRHLRRLTTRITAKNEMKSSETDTSATRSKSKCQRPKRGRPGR